MTVIETARLTLRPPVASDLDPLAAMMADAEGMAFLGGAKSRAEAWRWLAGNAGSWALYGFGMFSVFERATGLWIGRLGPWWPEGWPGGEVGWALAREAWGRGYAQEGAAAAVDHAFGTLGWDEVIHTINPANSASIVLAQRLGSVNRGPGQLPPPLQAFPVDVWGQTRAEWQARQTALPPVTRA